jgi:hypothetical protein
MYILLDNIAGTFETSWGTSGGLGGLPWQTGTGTPNTLGGNPGPSGVGNGDVYRSITSGDTTHASAAGYDYLGDRVLQGVASAIATY